MEIESQTINYLAINPNNTDLSFAIPVPKKLEDKWTIHDLKSELIKILEDRLKLVDKYVKINIHLKHGIQLYNYEDKPLSYFKDCQPFYFKHEVKEPIKLKVKHLNGKVIEHKFDDSAYFYTLLNKCSKVNSIPRQHIGIFIGG